MRKSYLALAFVALSLAYSCGDKEEAPPDPFLELTDFDFDFNTLNGCEFDTGNPGTAFDHTLSWRSTDNITPVSLTAVVDYGSGTFEMDIPTDVMTVEVSGGGGSRSDDVYEGTISFSWCYRFGSEDVSEFEYTWELRTSSFTETLMTTLNRPSGAN